MPILVDYSQVVLASLFAIIGNHTNADVDESTLRHMFLNSLRANRKQFTAEYGEIVLCVDDKRSWRREIFPYYKASRKKSREESELNWEELFRIIGVIKDEIDEFFPYKVIRIDGAEADDIIGCVLHEYGTPLWDGSEKFLILSGDKDYIQLHKYANVDQYNPVLKKYVRHSDPEQYLVEHVIKGDSGDGIPNILSPDNVFMLAERQKMMTAKRLLEYSSGPILDEDIKRKHERNTLLIDLSKTPEHIREGILAAYAIPKTTGRSKLFNYFIAKKLKNLMGFIQEF